MTAQPNSETRRDQPKVTTDPRRAAWKPFRDMCIRLAGDAVLVPPLMRRDRLTRHDLTPIAHWSDMTEDDIPRLAILTDSFARFAALEAERQRIDVETANTRLAIAALEAAEKIMIDGDPDFAEIDLVDLPVPEGTTVMVIDTLSKDAGGRS